MTAPFTDVVVRIRGPNRAVVGAGIHVGERHVLTCAHVVARALGAEAGVGARLKVDLPHRAKLELDATVVRWFPKVPPGDRETKPVSDVAVLDLAEPMPGGLKPDRLACLRSVGQHFVGYGFPVGYDAGTDAEGEMRYREPGVGGWLQVRALERFPVRLCISGVGDVICAFARRELIEQGADDGP